MRVGNLTRSHLVIARRSGDEATRLQGAALPYAILRPSNVARFFEELGHHAEARDALLLAQQHARNAAERAYIESRLAALGKSQC